MNRRLSESLLEIADSVEHEELNFGDLIARLEGRVYTLFLVLLALPFCSPAMIPGISTPFGLVISILGLRFALKKEPWLPKSLLARRIPTKYFPACMRVGAKVLRWIEKFLHPRATAIFEKHSTQFAAGMMLCVSGLCLLLPIPFPLSNTFPAVTIVVIASSFSERDGTMFAIGVGLFCATIAYLTGIFLGGAQIIQWVRELIFGA